MAVDEFPQTVFRDTEEFVVPKGSFWPASIPVAHHQLRHFISQPRRNIIYYANGKDIFELSVRDRTRKHIATLPFHVRCTASGHGWICAGGGDEGRWARIQLNPPRSAAEVDALLPLELESRQNGRRSRPILPPPLPRVTADRLGDDIVNSISLHRIQDDPSESAEILAVLTNNDRTVRVYSLTRETELARLELPFPVNHATISPDGQLLVAVGDFQQAYFFERVDGETTPSKTPSVGPKRYEWEILNIVDLHVPPPTTIIGYFTTAWSSNGSLVAMGSECGYVSLFDVEVLKMSECGEDALVDVFSGTRPDTDIGPGSIRSMIFAPQPWDLLVWAEDRGRVCVLDLRSGLRTRQVLHLIPHEPYMRRMTITDVHGRPATERPRVFADEMATLLRERERRLTESDFAEGFNQYAQRIQSVMQARDSDGSYRGEAENEWENADVGDESEDIAEAMVHRALMRADAIAPDFPRHVSYDPATNQPREFPWEDFSAYDLLRARDLARQHGQVVSLTVPAQDRVSTRQMDRQGQTEWNAQLIPWLLQVRTHDLERLPPGRAQDNEESNRRVRLALAAFRAHADLDQDDAANRPSTRTTRRTGTDEDRAWRLIESGLRDLIAAGRDPTTPHLTNEPPSSAPGSVFRSSTSSTTQIPPPPAQPPTITTVLPPTASSTAPPTTTTTTSTTTTAATARRARRVPPNRLATIESRTRRAQATALRESYDLPTPTALGPDGRVIAITTSGAPQALFVPRFSGHLRQNTGGAAAGLRTTGLSWSVDYEEGDSGDGERRGLRLWVGTEEGIFEMDVNLAGRRCWNSLVPI